MQCQSPDPIDLARLNPGGFTWVMNGGEWQYAPHIDCINERLIRVAQKKCPRLIIEMPPRHGKTTFATKHFSAWYLGHFPETEVLLGAYGATLAQKFGGEIRDILASASRSIFPWIKIKTDSKSKEDWRTVQGGGVFSAGVGGAFTGRGADLFIVEDPIKSPIEAHSKTYRDRVWAWFQAVVETRIHKGASIIVIMTRWHEDDLVGRLRKEFSDEWEVLSLPALALENDLLGREFGEALWPDMYSREELLARQRRMGSYYFGALYQQNPSSPEGTIFKRAWMNVADHCPNLEFYITSWDMSFGKLESKKASYVVGQVWGYHGGKYYLVHQVRERTDIVGALRMMEQVSEAFPKPRAILVEDKANGPAVIQLLKKSHRIIPITPQGSKLARATSVAPLFEADDVRLLRGAWLKDYIEEMCTFPRSENDDQVDSTSQALNWIEVHMGKDFRIFAPGSSNIITKPSRPWKGHM